VSSTAPNRMPLLESTVDRHGLFYSNFALASLASSSPSLASVSERRPLHRALCGSAPPQRIYGPSCKFAPAKVVMLCGADSLRFERS